MKDLNKLIDFMKFTHDIRRVKRAIVLDSDQNENDAEHGYQMAMTALFIIDSKKLKVDKYKCMAMALVHDVIEVYAGDIIVFAPKEDLTAKELREKEAIEELKANWPNLPTLHELVREYEDRQTPEARFVFALDKLLPEINNYLFGGKAWKKHGITLEQVKEIKKGKVELDDTINNYHKQVLQLLERHPEVFPKPRAAK